MDIKKIGIIAVVIAIVALIASLLILHGDNKRDLALRLDQIKIDQAKVIEQSPNKVGTTLLSKPPYAPALRVPKAEEEQEALKKAAEQVIASKDAEIKKLKDAAKEKGVQVNLQPDK